MGKNMNGAFVSKVLLEELKDYITMKNNAHKLGLVDISIGSEFGGKVYANMKKKQLEATGCFSVLAKHYDEISFEQLCNDLLFYNSSEDFDGVMLQLPLPEYLKKYERTILDFIDLKKDVDGLNSSSLGRLMVGKDGMVPCTPKGIITLLKVYDIDFIGKNVCIINRSNIVGKPLEQLFVHEDSTTTLCHSKTSNLIEITKNADILVAALNKREYIDSNYVKDGAIIIDVGVHKNEQGKVVGDVDYHSVYKKCSFITPPTGGVGPMTICMLAYNTAKSFYGPEVDEVLNRGIEKAKVLVK